MSYLLSKLAGARGGWNVSAYAYSADGHDIGYTLAVVGGATFTRTLTRDPHRRDLVLNVANSTGGNFVYTYDALSRPVTRNDDAFSYNARSEVASAMINGTSCVYGYDEIGNSTNWTANCLNQYTHCVYDADGNMTAYGPWSYTYDSASRLVSFSSNGVLLVTNFYDAKSRRVKKVTPTASHTFVYDGWNLIEERVAYTNGTISTIHYYWGKDLSGTLQGAGGVGGLVAASDIAKFNAQYGGLTVRTSVKFHDRLLYSSLVISAGIQYRF